MSIMLNSGPPGGHAAISDKLAQLINRGPRAALPQGGALGQDPPVAGDPVALYSLTVSEAAEANALEQSQQVGWLYLIFANTPLAIAEVRLNLNEEPQLKRLTRGPLVERLDQAFRYAQERYGTGSDALEARVLEVPELNTVALWLHGARREVLMTLLDATSQPRKGWEDEEFLSHLATRARLRLREGRGSNGPRARSGF